MTGAAKRPGGTGVSPVQAFKVTRRNLPHWQEPGRVYFVTWRCQDGQTLSPQERSVTLEAIKYWEGRRWTVYAAVVMAEHVHALVQPLPHPQGGFFDLSMILHSVKSFSVHQINRLRGTEGSLWQNGSISSTTR
jgi:putative transposase